MHFLRVFGHFGSLQDTAPKLLWGRKIKILTTWDLYLGQNTAPKHSQLSLPGLEVKNTESQKSTFPRPKLGFELPRMDP